MIAGLSGGGSLVVALAVALLLGLRHASDPDHLVAVSTLVASERERAARRAARLRARRAGLDGDALLRTRLRARPRAARAARAAARARARRPQPRLRHVVRGRGGRRVTLVRRRYKVDGLGAARNNRPF